jgi:dihydroorotase-like cyclic amidohydrolase
LIQIFSSEFIIERLYECVTHEPQAVVDGWLAEQQDTKITIVDGANKVPLYRGDGATKAKKTCYSAQKISGNRDFIVDLKSK